MNDSLAPPAEEPTAAPPPPPENLAATPGALLRLARERAGIGADQLATQLKLAKSTVEALERDDFAALSEPVYVRGYYRKIARVLPVSEAELLKAYQAHAAPVVARAPVQRIPLADGVDAGASRGSRMAGLGIALAVAAAAVVLLLMVDRRSSPPAVRSAVQPAAPVPALETAVTPPAPAPETAPPAAASGTAPASATGLVLEFTESSFVRVEDGAGKTLAIGLVRAGERQTLEGAPPYSLFLGNAQNVKVFFNGEPVDFSAHINTQNDTARFTVP